MLLEALNMHSIFTWLNAMAFITLDKNRCSDFSKLTIMPQSIVGLFMCGDYSRCCI